MSKITWANARRNYLVIACLAGLGAGIVFQGCIDQRHTVLASTGTNIGLDISQDPATQSPHAKLGYQRVELAIVPSNRTAKEEPNQGNSIGEGAKDVPDVLMELRYGGFGFTGSSGIYQRLAVGKIAVSQPGASFMLAKDADGTLKPETADAVARAHEASAFADKLRGSNALTTVAFLGEVYSGLATLAENPPKGQSDAKAGALKMELDNLVASLPSTYPFNAYREPKAFAYRYITADPAIGSPVPKAGAKFDLVLRYQNQLVLSIPLLQGLVKQPRNTFSINCVLPLQPAPPAAPVPPAPNCDSGNPDIATLTKELVDQQDYLKTFTSDWGGKTIVLDALDYFIASLRKPPSLGR
jgi:hypothetical protein